MRFSATAARAAVLLALVGLGASSPAWAQGAPSVAPLGDPPAGTPAETPAASPPPPAPAALIEAATPLLDPGAEPALAADAPAGPPPSGVRRGLGVAAAVFPGVLVGGAGHWVVGDDATAARLLWIKSAGFGALVAGAVPTGVSGASRRVVPWGIPLLGMGFGVFALATVADLYGAATGGTDGQPRAAEAQLTAGLEYVFVEDPQFAYGHLVAPSLAGWIGRFELGARADLAADDDHWRVQTTGRYRLLGAVAGRGPDGPDGSALDLRGALARQRHGTEGFTVYTPELAFAGRLDLVQLAPSLRGSFVTGELGWGLELLGYDHLGGGVEDSFNLLLLGIGAGVYLGDGAGEVALFYDHRRDDYAGGLSGGGIGVGIFGHLGLRGEVAVYEDLRLTGQVRVGSAWVAGLGVKWLYGSVAP